MKSKILNTDLSMSASEIAALKVATKSFGVGAVSVYNAILGQVNDKKTYFILWDQRTQQSTIESVPSPIEIHTLDKIIEFFFKVHLLDKCLFEQYFVLTNAEMQRRYLKSGKKGHIFSKAINTNYNLIK